MDRSISSNQHIDDILNNLELIEVYDLNNLSNHFIQLIKEKQYKKLLNFIRIFSYNKSSIELLNAVLDILIKYNINKKYTTYIISEFYYILNNLIQNSSPLLIWNSLINILDLIMLNIINAPNKEPIYLEILPTIFQSLSDINHKKADLIIYTTIQSILSMDHLSFAYFLIFFYLIPGNINIYINIYH